MRKKTLHLLPLWIGPIVLSAFAPHDPGLCAAETCLAIHTTGLAHAILATNHLTSPAFAGLDISPSTVPSGQYGTPYKQALQARGGTPPYTFSVSAGSLPPGITLSSNGTLSGTPTTAGTYSFTITATDATVLLGPLTGSQHYSLVVSPAALTVTANPETKEYGATDPSLTYTATGFVNGDNTSVLSGSLNRSPGENVGIYSITKGSLSAGPGYTISFTGNNLTITIASQHITWKQNLLVGCNSTTTVQLNATTSSGLPVAYSVADPTIATVTGNMLTLLRPGSTVVTAVQPGDANHTAAQPVYDTVLYQSASLIRQHWNDAIFFDNSNGTFVQWQWFKNGQAVPGATGPYYSETPSLNGQYYVVATNATGQQIQSCTLLITGTSKLTGSIKAQPNPVGAGGQVTVTTDLSAAALQGAILQVLDMNGKVRQEQKSLQPSTQLTMPTASGIYIISLQLANGQKATTNVLVID